MAAVSEMRFMTSGKLAVIGKNEAVPVGHDYFRHILGLGRVDDHRLRSLTTVDPFGSVKFINGREDTGCWCKGRPST